VALRRRTPTEKTARGAAAARLPCCTRCGPGCDPAPGPAPAAFCVAPPLGVVRVDARIPALPVRLS